MLKYITKFFIVACLLFASHRADAAHEITFCGEKIPVSDNFVAEKLMNIIRRQIPNVNLPALRARANKYFSTVEYYLAATGLPQDFKYLAIVESGFNTSLVSHAGAAGFWQLMPATAREWGLSVDGPMDERSDINKSTHAACKVLAQYYMGIRKKYGISSWVLTAAAYNFGSGNIFNAINRQGNNYFQMNLNAETAAYVYKIIAVKELWEYPELYMKDFGYNVFNAAAANKTTTGKSESSFGSMKVNVSEDDGFHPTDINTNKIPSKGKKMKGQGNADLFVYSKVKFVTAHIEGKYKKFEDGNVVSIELDEDFQIGNTFIRRGNTIKGTGYLIDDNVYIDLGYGRNIIVYDTNNKHNGVSKSSLKKNKSILLKVNGGYK